MKCMQVSALKDKNEWSWSDDLPACEGSPGWAVFVQLATRVGDAKTIDPAPPQPTPNPPSVPFWVAGSHEWVQAWAAQGTQYCTSSWGQWIGSAQYQNVSELPSIILYQNCPQYQSVAELSRTIPYCIIITQYRPYCVHFSCTILPWWAKSALNWISPAGNSLDWTETVLLWTRFCAVPRCRPYCAGGDLLNQIPPLTLQLFYACPALQGQKLGITELQLSKQIMICLSSLPLIRQES